jgi:putative Mg2+ transporter-C (MgtC) family protein
MVVSTQVAIHPWKVQTPGQGVNINVDPARIAYGVMAGIGFLGAGVIVHDGGSTRGLTTAAGLWCAAAIGLGVGIGMYTVCIAATVLVILALTVLDGFECLLPKVHYRTITLRTKWKPNCVATAVDKFKSPGLRVDDAYFEREEQTPQLANVHLRISFVKRAEYEQMERKIEADPDFDLMAAKDA